MAAWIPAAIGAAGLIGGNFLSARQSGKNVRATNRANRELAEYSFQKNLEMWERQNEYNTPEAQMKRFQEAGLSKHMIYGQGTPGNATGMPTYTPPNIDFRGRQSMAGETLKSITGASADSLELVAQEKRLKGIEAQSALQKLNATIRSMDVPGANLQYLMDMDRSDAYINLFNNREALMKMYQNDIVSKLSENEQRVLGNKLKNHFQGVVNRYADQGITLSDNMYIRAGLALLQSLGINIKLEDLMK